VCAAFYAVVLLTTLPSVVTAIYRNSDIAAAPEIGELSSRAPGFAQTVLGNAPWYTGLWFEQLTRWVPEHRVLWELTPWVLTLLGIGLVAWAAARVAGRWAAAIIAVCCACAGSTLLPLQFAWSIHAVSYFHICVLGAFLVLLALSSDRSAPWGWQVVLAALVMLVTGLGMASDKLVIIGGLVPFVIAGSVLWRLSPAPAASQVLATVLAVTLGSCVVAVLAKATAHSQNVVPAPFPISFAGLNQLPSHVGDLAGSLAVLANGDFSHQGLSLTGVLALFAAGATAMAIIAAVRQGRAIAVQIAAVGRATRSHGTPEAAARATFLSFWIATAALLSAAFVVSGIPRGLTTSRYLVPVGYAVVAIIAVSAAQKATAYRGLVVAGVSAIVLSAAVSVAQHQIQNGAYAPDSGPAQRLAQFAAREHLTTGYAGYWDASALSWELGSQPTIYPVITCATGLCPFPYHKINTWYVPRPVAHSFFIVDSRLLRLGAYGAINGPPSSFGTPEQVAHLGPLTVYVYPYNLAGKLLPS
jgi:hypothetical protein